jgi:hypothetical protein
MAEGVVASGETVAAAMAMIVVVTRWFGTIKKRLRLLPIQQEPLARVIDGRRQPVILRCFALKLTHLWVGLKFPLVTKSLPLARTLLLRIPLS